MNIKELKKLKIGTLTKVPINFKYGGGPWLNQSYNYSAECPHCKRKRIIKMGITDLKAIGYLKIKCGCKKEFAILYATDPLSLLVARMELEDEDRKTDTTSEE